MTNDNEKIATGREARQLLRAHRYGALSTLSKKFDGYPFGSITPYLVDHDGSLLILISTLAEHTKNIQHDPRVSLITHNQESPHIQTQGRITVLGTAAVENNLTDTGKRYLRYFPEAQDYFSMHDFSFYRIVPHAIRYIGGFGNIHWVRPEKYLCSPSPLMQQEQAVIEEMNAEHKSALMAYTPQEDESTELIGIDCDGFDLRSGERIIRIQSKTLILDAQQARLVLTRQTS